MIGQTIAHYRILDKLGQGGMGEVYLAEDTKLDRKVALKFLPESLSRDPEARERLLREAKATSRLNHPNILTVHSVEQFDGRDYIVMEYIDGQPLDDLTRARELPLADLLGLALQIAEGLQKAHQSGIVHRDIKPSNILVDADRRARLLDFGLATYQGAAKLTQTGSTLGTAAYMSPEQALSRECDHRADLFSLGVVLYEMITGQLPFRGEHSAALVYAIVNDQPEPLARYKSDTPEMLQRIVSKCLAKRPNERYQSAADLVADLRHLRRESEKPGPAAVTVQPKRKMLAVLPFENLGPAEDEYFADGITEEIISRLAAVKELGVISRTSVMQYKDTRKPIRDIGAELGADHILEGTVRWGKAAGGVSRVRITPQLIKVSDDTHLWSDRYDRVLEDIFDVQSDIAEQVTRQLNVTLLEPEKDALHARPTKNLEAYNAYLRGKEYMNRPSYVQRNFEMALKVFTRAVELDAEFALAWAELCKTHSDLFHHGYDRTPARAELAKSSIDRAIRLQPDSFEVQLAHGLYLYRCHKDYERALAEFVRASAGAPNVSAVWLYTGAVRRRQGDFLGALNDLRKAYELDPRNGLLPPEIGTTLSALRRYEEADQMLQRAIEVAPDQILAYVFRANNQIAWDGDLKRARIWLDPASFDQRDDANALSFVARFFLLERDAAGGLAYVDSWMSEIYESQAFITSKSMMRGLFLELLLRQDEAIAAFSESLRSLMAFDQETPNDFRVQTALAIVHAHLNHSAEVLKYADRAEALCSLSHDHMSGAFVTYFLADAYSVIGEKERACITLEQLLNAPTMYSRHTVRLNPAFDAMRGYERFDTLMAQEETVF